MKKILPILVVGFLILGGFGAVTVAKTCIKINHEPEAPEIEGEWLINEPGPYEYTFKAVDPDNDDLFYQIDWEGDHVIDERVGPFTSGEKVKVRREVVSKAGCGQDVWDYFLPAYSHNVNPITSGVSFQSGNHPAGDFYSFIKCLTLGCTRQFIN